MIFFELLSTAFMSVFYGLVVTAAVMALLYFALRQLQRGIVESVPFYVTGVVLALVLTVQVSLMSGAFEVKGYMESVATLIKQMTEGYYGVVTAQESQDILNRLIDATPLLGVFIDTCDFSGNDVSDLPQVMSETFGEVIDAFIWRRFWWSLCTIVVAVAIAICARKRPRTYNIDASMDDLGIY